MRPFFDPLVPEVLTVLPKVVTASVLEVTNEVCQIMGKALYTPEFLSFSLPLLLPRQRARTSSLSLCMCVFVFPLSSGASHRKRDHFQAAFVGLRELPNLS